MQKKAMSSECHRDRRCRRCGIGLLYVFLPKRDMQNDPCERAARVCVLGGFDECIGDGLVYELDQ